MPLKIPTSTGFVIASAFAIASVTFVSAASEARQSDRQIASPAAQEPPEGAASQSTQSTIPTVAPFYTLVDGELAGLRVAFLQDKEGLTSTWMTAKGDVYGRGTYRWDAATGSFTGTSTTRFLCFAEDNRPANASPEAVPTWRPGFSATTSPVRVREQLYVVNDRELRDRWTKPLSVDCLSGVVEIFRWVEQVWIATDKDWKPLGPPPAVER
jgi:hypothetical protein